MKKRSQRSADTAKALLDSLPKPNFQHHHKWQHMADAIAECDGLMDVTPTAFTVPDEHGSRKIEAEGGWTEEHYEFLAPLLAGLSEGQLDKARLAEMVLKNQVRRGGCPEPDTAFWLLAQKHGTDEEKWLLQQVQAKGFTTLAREMVQALTEYRSTTPRPRISKRAKPTWDADLGQLSVGDKVIKAYTEAAENQRRVLDAFQEENFRHRIDDPTCVKAGEPTFEAPVPPPRHHCWVE